MAAIRFLGLALGVWATAAASLQAEGVEIFAEGVTGIGDTGATLVFTTTAPASATVTLKAEGEPDRTVKDEAPGEIHRLALDNLAKGKAYLAEIAAATPDGAAAPARTVRFTAARRLPSFEPFAGVTLFGSGFTGDLDLCAEAHLNVARLEATWLTLQPRPGPLDPGALAALVKNVDGLAARGIEPLLVLCYGTPWAQVRTHRQMTWRNPTFGPPDSLDDWRAYVTAVMEACKGKVHYYEVWNEPDAGYLAGGVFAERPGIPAPLAAPLYRGNDAYWLGDRYVPMAMAVREAADAVDPSIQVIGPSWNHDYHGRNGKLVFDRGLAPYLQDYSFHNYVSTPHSFAKWKAVIGGTYLPAADDVGKKHGIDLPWACTEWGAEAYDQPPAGGGFSTQRDRQRFLIKSAFFYLGLQRVRLAVMFDLGPGADPYKLVSVDAQGRRTLTPGFATYRWICQALGGKKYEIAPVSLAAAPEALAVAVRQAGTGDTYLALWQDAYDEKAGAVKAVPRRETAVTLSGMADGAYVRERLDADGTVAGSEAAAVSGGVLTWNETLPESDGQGESEPVVYRFHAKAG